MKVIPRLIVVLLVFGITFSLITLSAQIGDFMSGSVVKVSESTPFALMSVFVLALVFLVIALLVVGVLNSSK